MAVVLAKYKLAYFPVPKVACTSIKRLVFDIENNRAFEPFTANGQRYHIHKFYRAIPFDKTPKARLEEFSRLAVVRDPIKRFLSCYSNRVIYHKELSPMKAGEALKAMSLTPDPELDEFIEHFEDYQKANRSILDHSRPIVHFLGENASYYTKVYPMEQIESFVQDVNDLTGQDHKLGHFQTGGPKLSISDIPARQMDKLKSYYARDYESYGAFF